MLYGFAMLILCVFPRVVQPGEVVPNLIRTPVPSRPTGWPSFVGAG